MEVDSKPYPMPIQNRKPSPSRTPPQFLRTYILLKTQMCPLMGSTYAGKRMRISDVSVSEIQAEGEWVTWNSFATQTRFNRSAYGRLAETRKGATYGEIG
jgi:hypothetical protein